MSDSTPSIEKLEKQLRVLRKKLERSERHRADLENQHDRDQHLYRQLHADLEAAHREAEIEAALERVRARTMAMHHSEELAEAAGVAFQQLKALGVVTEADRFAFGIFDEAKGEHTLWITEPGGR